MFVSCKIQVLTVITDESIITYQQAYVNDEKAAKEKYSQCLSRFNESNGFHGWTVTLRTF